MGIPLSFSAAFCIGMSIAAKPFAKLFLHSQTAETQEIIANLVQITLPILAVNEILGTLLHGERTIMQSQGARIDKKTDAEREYRYQLENRNGVPPKSKSQMTESAIVAGHTAFFKLALFLPLAYAIGLKLDYGLPGMAGIYMICMLALLLSLAPRMIHALKNPDGPASSYLPAEIFKRAARNLITFCGTTFNRYRGADEGEVRPLLTRPSRSLSSTMLSSEL
jgi:hypothetical protein